MYLKSMMNKNLEQNFFSNQNGKDKVNSISENSTKNKVSLWVLA